MEWVIYKKDRWRIELDKTLFRQQNQNNKVEIKGNKKIEKSVKQKLFEVPWILREDERQQI